MPLATPQDPYDTLSPQQRELLAKIAATRHALLVAYRDGRRMPPPQAPPIAPVNGPHWASKTL